jgi:putative membrane protein
MHAVLSNIVEGLGDGVPVLLLHFTVTLLLLGAAMFIYLMITPFREHYLIIHGNVAAALLFAGAILALALPLAAMLAKADLLIDLVIWGIVALLIQLLAFGVACLFIRDLRHQIEAGNIAVAIALAGGQLAVAVINAAAISG